MDDRVVNEEEDIDLPSYTCWICHEKLAIAKKRQHVCDIDTDNDENSTTGSSGSVGAVASTSNGHGARAVTYSSGDCARIAALRAVREAAARATRARATSARATANVHPSDEVMQILHQHRFTYVRSDEETHVVTTKRAHLIEKCIAMTMCDSFLDFIQRPLVVQFHDEEGIDGGALRNDVFGSVLKHFQPFF